jgi:hypothetical protein
MRLEIDLPKPPRWISTEAGLWAWHEDGGWRTSAANALSVQERNRLLREAEQMLQAAATAAAC